MPVINAEISDINQGKMKLARLVALTTLLCLPLANCASDGERTRQAVARGKSIAQTWCSECHRISPDQPSGARPGHILPPPVNAPSFMAVADRPNVDAAYLRGFVSELHLPMPTFRLLPSEQDDVIAYILSLKIGS